MHGPPSSCTLHLRPWPVRLRPCFRRRGPLAGNLPGRDVDPIPHVDERNLEHDGAERPLVVVARRLLPDVVGHRIRAVAEPRHRFGQRQRRALLVGEIRRVAPAGDGERAQVGLAALPRAARVQIEADGAAVDLAGAQVDKIECLLRDAALLDRRGQGHHGLHGVGKNQGRVAHPCLHGVLLSMFHPLSHRVRFVRQRYDETRRRNVTDG